jgi:hypothetical protein
MSCAAYAIPLLPIHYGNPVYCAKCQVERARMVAGSTATLPAGGLMISHTHDTDYEADTCPLCFPSEPAYRPDQLLAARHDTPDQTGAVVDFEPLSKRPTED